MSGSWSAWKGSAIKDANTGNTNLKMKMWVKPVTTFQQLSSQTWKGFHESTPGGDIQGLKEVLEWWTKWKDRWLCVCQWIYQPETYSNKLRGAFLTNTNKIIFTIWISIAFETSPFKIFFEIILYKKWNKRIYTRLNHCRAFVCYIRIIRLKENKRNLKQCHPKIILHEVLLKRLITRHI